MNAIGFTSSTRAIRSIGPTVERQNPAPLIFGRLARRPETLRRLARRRKIQVVRALYLWAPCKAPEDKWCRILTFNRIRPTRCFGSIMRSRSVVSEQDII